MTDLIIELSRRYGETGHPFDRLVFRVPRWQDFVDLGDIEEWQPVDGDGERMMIVRHHDVVAQYAERCLKEPASPSALASLDLVDTLAVHAGMRDFFVKARSSRKQQTDSSGSSEKGSTKSGD